MDNIESPISPLLNAAIALYEMFKTLMEAGFTERQAILIVGEAIRTQQEQPPS